MSKMNEWFCRAKTDFFTVGEERTLEELMHILGPDAQDSIGALCDAVYKIGQLNSTDVKPAPDKLLEETKKWLDAQTPEERLEKIKDICVDWDGYRTAAGLGRLINEIWAYAAYPCKNEAHVMSLDELKHTTLETIWYESKIDNELTQSKKESIAALFLAGTLLNWSGFNKTWRCWDKKPTPEQIKEVPWSEAIDDETDLH